MDGVVGTAPPGSMYVRALYDYEADDRTSLSFHEGDVIQVITQLESGWWDGVINGVRGWFPSNYCQAITSPDEFPEPAPNGIITHHIDDDVDEHDIYDDSADQDEDSESEAFGSLPLEGTDMGDKSRADFWIPQATPDGRLFYYNMMTGDRSMELPLESPGSSAETGPRDRMNVAMPEKTRPPPEMMARGLTQDEDDDSATSASEAEGESLMHASRGSMVRNIDDTTRCAASPFCGRNLILTLPPASHSRFLQCRPLAVNVNGLDERHLARPAEEERCVRPWIRPQLTAAKHRIGDVLHEHHVQRPGHDQRA